MSTADAAPFKSCGKSSPFPGLSCPTAISQAGYCTAPPAQVDRVFEAPARTLAIIVGSNWPASPSPSDDAESTTWSHDPTINLNRRHCSYNAINDKITCDMQSACDASEVTIVSDGHTIAAYGTCTVSSIDTDFCCVLNTTLYPVDTVALTGTTGSDTLAFRALPYNLEAPVRRAEIWGLAGVDTIDGSDETEVSYRESLYGGDNTDYIEGHDGNDRIEGNGGGDNLYGGAGRDLIFGGAGVDDIDGGPNRDYLYGGSEGDGISGGDGNDYLFAGTGTDVMYGGRGSDHLYGSNQDNYMEGGPGYWTDYLYGFGGDDRLFGEDGDDELYGGTGDDRLHGGRHNDLLVGGPDNDEILGGAHDDVLWGGLGNDLLVGGFGYDNLCETEFDTDGDPTTGGVNNLIGGDWDPFAPGDPPVDNPGVLDRADVLDDQTIMPVQEGFNDVQQVTMGWVSTNVLAPGQPLWFGNNPICDDVRAQNP